MTALTRPGIGLNTWLADGGSAHLLIQA